MNGACGMTLGEQAMRSGASSLPPRVGCQLGADGSAVDLLLGRFRPTQAETVNSWTRLLPDFRVQVIFGLWRMFAATKTWPDYRCRHPAR